MGMMIGGTGIGVRDKGASFPACLLPLESYGIYVPNLSSISEIPLSDFAQSRTTVSSAIAT